tara:strand:+ start:176 stop:538 length:363 start_codon:yes stop_codon:yes gene_type:complete
MKNMFTGCLSVLFSIVFLATSSFAKDFEWTAGQAKDFSKMYKAIKKLTKDEHKDIDYKKGASAAKACTKFGEGKPCGATLCKALEKTMSQVKKEFPSQSDFPKGWDVVQGPLRTAQQYCK